MNCAHGLDERFCSICNRVRGLAVAARRAGGNASLDEILEFLKGEIIKSGTALILRLSIWRAARSEG